jgi:hypothetical protein
MGLLGRIHMRPHDAARARIQQAGCAMPVEARHPHQRRDANLHGSHTDLRCSVLGDHRMFQVDIDRIETAFPGHQRDVHGLHLLHQHGQAQSSCR